MTTISLRLEDEVKRELDKMCGEMGMSLTTFFTIYAKRALRERRIPFEITAPPADNTFSADELDWNSLREAVLSAETKDAGVEGIPWTALRDAMKDRVHGRI